jgi:hypothetical protein
MEAIFEIDDNRLQYLLEEGQWCYNVEKGHIVNIGTGEILDALQWLSKERKTPWQL